MNRFKIIFTLIVVSAICKSQTEPNSRCGTKTPSQYWNNAFNEKTQDYTAKHQIGKTQAAPITIPVIVHVLHFGQSVGTYPNLAQGQINSQITILNNDFAGIGLNIANLPAVFVGLNTNTGISFCLAQLDTNGVTLAEPGIDRIDLSTTTFTSYGGPLNPASYATTNDLVNFIDYAVKPNTIWNASKYLNIWISDRNASVGLYGFAKFPSIPSGTLVGLPTGDIATNTTDGVWMFAKAFGSVDVFSSGIYYPNYNKGNIATHEVGHWLGLRHIWGDGNCATDYCNDTPPAHGFNTGYPMHPYNLGACSGNTTGELFYNYMDYSIDSCITMFTPDQNTRMQTALAYCTNRNQLAQSSTTLCFPVPIAPTASFVIASIACTNSLITINNLSYDNAMAPLPILYTWSVIPNTGVTFSPNNSAASPSVSFTFPGSYFISVVASNSVGTNSTMQSTNANFCTTTILNKNGENKIGSLLYPNPTNGSITVLNDVKGIHIFQVFDVTGKLVFTANLKTEQTNINLNELLNGLYIYKIISNNTELEYGKIIKQ